MTPFRAAFAALMLVFVSAPAARAEWERPLLVPGSAAHAAFAPAGGGVGLLAGARVAERFTWTPGAPLDRRTLPVQVGTRGAANARGDVLLVAGSARRVRGVLIEAGGARAEFSHALPRGTGPEMVDVALAEDGTAVVAWTRTATEAVEFYDVGYALRRPGAGFDPVASVPADGATVVAAAALDAGRGELAFSDGAIQHVALPGGEPTVIADTGEDLQGLQLAGGRVTTFADRLVSYRRGVDGAWAGQVLDVDGRASGRPMAANPDGGAVVVYSAGRDVVARRAAPGADFGAPQRVGRTPRLWSAYSHAAAIEPGGRALALWKELSVDELRFGEICGAPCHDRVQVAAAGPGTAFGAPRRVSPLGSASKGAPVAAVSGTGERLVAWRDQRGLVALHGSGEPDAPQPADRRGPRVRVDRVRGRTVLRARLRCDEACEAYVTLTSQAASRFVGDLTTLAPIALDRAGARTFEWRLTPFERRRLASVRQRGRVWVAVSAVDGRGNRSEYNRRVE